MSEFYVDIQGMSFSRGNREIYKNVSIQIPKGKITAIMGPSGTGKTTLLRLIGGQLFPSIGSVLVDGKNVPLISRTELYTLRKKIGMLFQSGALFSDISVFENVAFPLREHTNYKEETIRDIVLMKLESVGLRGAAQLMPSELSGGMARRAALARAIALDPELVLYDEPFAGQDPISMGVVVELIKRLNDSVGITSVLVSHDVTESLSIADYVYIISNACVVAQGTPEEIRCSDDERVVQFLGGLPDGPVPFHYPANSYKADLDLER
nr:ATP-binding cassette domain-containing protein [Marinomonas algicola]